MAGFHPGDLICRSKPYVYALEEREKRKRCDYCFAVQSHLKRCSQCGYMYFCDQNCQKMAWTDHKLECKLMKNSARSLTKSLLVISRILLKIKNYGIHEPVEEIWGQKVDIGRLMSHSDEVSDECVTTGYGILRHYFQEKGFPSVSSVREIIGKVRTNAFSILDPDSMQSIGGGVYLGASMFDHSCQPNAEVVFNGPEMIIRATKEIPEKDITQVYISYIEEIQLTEDRVKFLNEQYYFTCKCSRCTSSYYDDLLSKTAVTKAECEFLLDDFKEKVASIKQMRIDKVAPGTIHEACLKELQKQTNILTETHLYRIKILEYAFDSCIDNSQWTDAVIYGEQLLLPYKLLYGKYHPQLGLHFFKLGKILNILERLEPAKQYLLQAEDNIKITHGEDHPLYQELVHENLSLL